MRLAFGKWTLDPTTKQLTSLDTKIELSMPMYKLLSLFLAHPHEVVSFAAIKQSVWGTEYVTDNLVYQTIRNLRLALEANQDELVYIKNIPRHGYQFLLDVEEVCSDKLPSELNQSNVLWPVSSVLALVCLALVAFWFYRPATSTLPEFAVYIEDVQVPEVLQTYLTSLEVDVNVAKLDSAEVFHTNQNKMLMSYLPGERAVLQLVFNGNPSRLVHIALHPLNEFTVPEQREQIRQGLMRAFEISPSTEGDANLHYLLNAPDFDSGSLFTLKMENTAEARQALERVREAFSDGANDKQLAARRAFINILAAYYQIEFPSIQRLVDNANLLLSLFGQSAYTQAAVALVLTDLEQESLGYQFIKHQEQDNFLSFLRGLLHWDFSEYDDAMTHFEQVYQLAPGFEDNSFLYLDTLKRLQRHAQIEAMLDGFQAQSFRSDLPVLSLYEWMVYQGKTQQAIDVLYLNTPKLNCSAQLLSALAYVGIAMDSPDMSSYWVSQLEQENDRNTLLPTLKFSLAEAEGKWGDYISWFETQWLHHDEVSAGMISLYLNALRESGDMDKLESKLPLLLQAPLVYISDGEATLSNALLHSVLAKSKGETMSPWLDKAEEVIRHAATVGVPIKRLGKIQFYTLKKDYALAQAYFIDECRRRPSRCKDTRLPMTQDLLEAIEQAQALIEANRSKIDELSWEFKYVCNLD